MPQPYDLTLQRQGSTLYENPSDTWNAEKLEWMERRHAETVARGLNDPRPVPPTKQRDDWNAQWASSWAKVLSDDPTQQQKLANTIWDQTGKLPW